uniref:Putative u3 small nucleolar ribonucleoprotein snornp component n=1 Tax=Lutzomyia longipalpis TaxID=7200 RepID=A0A1B0C8Q6_LUTLO
MVRKLKFHEQKLLKKVDFIKWGVDNTLHENKIMRKYHIQKREEYTMYNKLSREIREIAKKITTLDAADPFRTDASSRLLEKLYILGLIPTKWDLDKMSETTKNATKLVEHGHVRVGADVVKDPAFLVSRTLEDFVTWVDGSAIRQHKLLKKVDFIKWGVDNTLHENKIMRKYHIQKREEYTMYNKLSREIREIAKKISTLDAADPFRTDASSRLLEKLYILGLIPTKWDLDKMSETTKNATKLVEHGHVRVGADVVKDPAFLVSRTLEDFVTWVDGSAIRQHVLEYNDLRDDFEM